MIFKLNEEMNDPRLTARNNELKANKITIDTLTYDILDVLEEHGYDADAQDVIDYAEDAANLLWHSHGTLNADVWYEETEENYPEDLAELTKKLNESVDSAVPFGKEIKRVTKDGQELIIIHDEDNSNDSDEFGYYIYNEDGELVAGEFRNMEDVDKYLSKYYNNEYDESLHEDDTLKNYAIELETGEIKVIKAKSMDDAANKVMNEYDIPLWAFGVCGVVDNDFAATCGKFESVNTSDLQAIATQKKQATEFNKWLKKVERAIKTGKNIKELKQQLMYLPERRLSIKLASGLIDMLKEAEGDKLEMVKRINEGNPVSGGLPSAIDQMLQDVAQMTEKISYNNIIDFGKVATKSDIAKLRSLRKDWREVLDVFDDDEINDVAQDIAEIVLGTTKSESLHESYDDSMYVDIDEIIGTLGRVLDEGSDDPEVFSEVEDLYLRLVEMRDDAGYQIDIIQNESLKEVRSYDDDPSDQLMCDHFAQLITNEFGDPEDENAFMKAIEILVTTYPKIKPSHQSESGH